MAGMSLRGCHGQMASSRATKMGTPSASVCSLTLLVGMAGGLISSLNVSILGLPPFIRDAGDDGGPGAHHFEQVLHIVIADTGYCGHRRPAR